MDDGAAMLRAIITQPAEDTPRLAYADWLDEHDEGVRAAAIRAHIRAHVLDPKGSRVLGLGKHYLPTVGQSSWHGLMTTVTAVTSNPKLNGLSKTLGSFARADLCEWSRGFVDLITCDAPDWVEEGDTVRREQPVTRVVLTSTPAFKADGDHARLADDPAARDFTWSEIDRVAIPGAEPPDASDATVLRLLMLRWPGVAFELPSD